jgi:lysophospholipid acyltransferase (LPLAT)-like uncharacterized protein
MTLTTLWNDVKYRLLHLLILVIGVVYFYLVEKTSKTSVLGQDHHDTLKEKYPNVIYVAWHEHLVLGLWVFHHQGLSVLISQSRDGEYASRFIPHLGFYPVRGSSTRGGVRGLLQLAQILKTRGDVVIIADGPQGPARQCKAGAIMLAKHSGLPIVPVACLVTRFKRIRSWDRLFIPYPFCTFKIGYGSPIFVPQDADKRAIAEYQIRTEQALDRMIKKLEQ